MRLCNYVLEYITLNYLALENYPQSYKIQARWRDETMSGLVFRIIGNAQRVTLKIGALLVGIHFEAFPFNLAAGYAAWKAADVLKGVCDEMASLSEIDHLLSKHDVSELKAAIGHGSGLANKLKKYKTMEDVPKDLQKEINQFLNNNYKTIKELESALQSADQRERKEVNVYLKKDKKKSFKEYRMEQIKSAYKIKPQHLFGDTPTSNLLRIIGSAQSKILRWGTFLSGFYTYGAGFALTIPAVIISGKINDLCKEVASLMDIENLLSKQDQAALRALIGTGTNLANKMKKYKNFGDMPSDLQHDVNAYFNLHYKSITQLKDALNTVQVKASKSLAIEQAQAEAAQKYVPHTDRRLI